MIARVNRSKNRLSTEISIRALIAALLCLALSLLFFRDFWLNLPYLLSPDWIFGQNHAAPWGVLALCVLFLWAKRRKINDAINHRYGNQAFTHKTSLMHYLQKYELLIGTVLIAGSVFIPSSGDSMVFRVLLAGLGVFVAVFGMKASRIPSILLAIYGFVIVFPLAIYHFAEKAYTLAAVIPLKEFLSLLHYPLQVNGQMITIIANNNETIPAFVSSACSGPATMAVFIVLFTLMMLDTPLPPKKAAWLFLIGITGTWLQSFLRLIILMLAAYYLGKEAMWAAHSWSIYILFPMWYLIFAFIYFRQVKKATVKKKPKLTTAGVAVP